MKKFIKDVLVQMHRETTTDKYGQVGRINFTSTLFGDRKEEVEQYCKENEGVLLYSAYGSSYGTYKAFTIQDAEIRKACSEALLENENYIRSINTY